MAKTLPYFRWYPADAETDEAYASMTDAELGFFHRCLNRAWVNGSLPADLDQLAFAMRVRRSYLDKIWPKVGKCFHHVEVGTRLVNRRQEEERKNAVAKSIANQRIGNANAKRTERDLNANAPQHAPARADVECESVSECTEGGPGGNGAQEFPETAAAVRGYFRAADDALIAVIAQKSFQAYASVVNGHSSMPTLTDALLAEAVHEAKFKKQYSPGPFLESVPRVVKSWAEEALRNGSIH